MSDLKDFVIINSTLKKYRGAGGDVVIPDSIKNIGEGAFNYCENLTSVNFPLVTSLDTGSFYSCKKLTKAIFLPDTFFLFCL